MKNEKRMKEREDKRPMTVPLDITLEEDFLKKMKGNKKKDK